MWQIVQTALISLVVFIFSIFIYDKYFSTKIYVFDYEEYFENLMERLKKGEITQDQAIKEAQEVKEELNKFSKNHKAIILFKTSVIDGTAEEIKINK